MSAVCVLLVEDNDRIRVLLTEELRDAGFDVVGAQTGDEAVELIYDPPMTFTALVTDLHMLGHADGADVAASRRSIWPSTPVIIVLGRPDVFEPHWKQNLGYKLLRKPLLASDLVRLVASLTG